MSTKHTHGRIIVETAGYGSGEVLMFDPRRTTCGGIKDGVALAHGGECGWVISFSDLKDMYELAVAHRAAPENLALLDAEVADEIKRLERGGV